MCSNQNHIIITAVIKNHIIITVIIKISAVITDFVLIHAIPIVKHKANFMIN